jgi:hypothetical protein
MWMARSLPRISTVLILVYNLTDRYTRSISRATLVDEVEVDKMPKDQIAFAARHGGDFIEIAAEETLQMKELA